MTEYEGRMDPERNRLSEREVTMKGKAGHVYDQPGQSVDFSIFPRVSDTQVRGITIHEVYFRTESDNIYYVDSDGILIDGRRSKEQRRLARIGLPQDKYGSIMGIVVVGEPFISGNLKTTKVTEIVTASEELRNPLEFERQLLARGEENPIIEDFEKLLSL